MKRSQGLCIAVMAVRFMGTQVWAFNPVEENAKWEIPKLGAPSQLIWESHAASESKGLMPAAVRAFWRTPRWRLVLPGECGDGFTNDFPVKNMRIAIGRVGTGYTMLPLLRQRPVCVPSALRGRRIRRGWNPDATCPQSYWSRAMLRVALKVPASSL